MIHVKNLTKIYPNGKGIFDVTFELKTGEVFGFLGPNGAGKTTTMRQLMGFTNPTSGNCTINGYDTRKETAKIQSLLGYVPGEIAFFDYLTGFEFIDFISQLRGYEDKKRRQNLMDRFELDGSRKIKRMSKGMKQKVGLITAFCHNPQVILLDEPTSGLDPLMQRRFIELIQEEKKAGKTILLSSHIFDEVEKTCERAAIIKEGRIVAMDHIANLKGNLRKSFYVTLENEADEIILLQSQLEIKKINELQYEILTSKNYDHLFKTLSQCKVTHFDSPSQSLEQIFIGYYGKEIKS